MILEENGIENSELDEILNESKVNNVKIILKRLNINEDSMVKIASN